MIYRLRPLRRMVLSALFLLSYGWALVAPGSAQAQESLVRYPLLPPRYSSIKVFDVQGRFVGRVLPEKRYWVPIERIPVFLQNALVAIEDARFYEHSGIDLRGIARALVKDVIKGRMAEGGSTITQQLIKNKYLSQEKTIQRKVKEGLLAMEYERKYSKKKILEMYFNEVFFGNGAWGIAQAARLYFDKNPEELNEAESALLAGVPKAPTRYNPLGDPNKVRDRRNLVLRRMVELQMISSAQGGKLMAGPVSIIKPGEAPYYMDHIRQQTGGAVWTGSPGTGGPGGNRAPGSGPAAAGGTGDQRRGDPPVPRPARGLALP